MMMDLLSKRGMSPLPLKTQRPASPGVLSQRSVAAKPVADRFVRTAQPTMAQHQQPVGNPAPRFSGNTPSAPQTPEQIFGVTTVEYDRDQLFKAFDKGGAAYSAEHMRVALSVCDYLLEKAQNAVKKAKDEGKSEQELRTLQEKVNHGKMVIEQKKQLQKEWLANLDRWDPPGWREKKLTAAGEALMSHEEKQSADTLANLQAARAWGNKVIADYLNPKSAFPAPNMAGLGVLSFMHKERTAWIPVIYDTTRFPDKEKMDNLLKKLDRRWNNTSFFNKNDTSRMHLEVQSHLIHAERDERAVQVVLFKNDEAWLRTAMSQYREADNYEGQLTLADWQLDEILSGLQEKRGVVARAWQESFNTPIQW